MTHCKRSHQSCAQTASHQLSRRDFLKVAGISAAGLALASCQKSLEESSAPQGKKPTVAIARADSYDRSLIRKQMEDLFDKIGGLSSILAHGNRVAIKTNLTGGTSATPLPGIPEIESYLTHPEVVRATGELLLDSGVTKLSIVEAVYEKASWPVYGYEDVAKELGAELVDLNYPDPYPDYVKVVPGTDPMIYEEFTFNPVLQEIDAFVSVSKMKCHNIAGVTHTMKNLVGLVPYRFYEMNPGDKYRSAIHGRSGETRKRLPRAIVDLNTARPIQLGVIDGIWTAEAGEGPWIPALTQIKPGLLFAGKDVVATDAVATAAMGFDPTADYPDAPFVNGENHLNIAASLGMGTNQLENIKVVGEKLEDVTKQFTPSY
jgi:uncharacterized protein (DUF362 family)